MAEFKQGDRVYSEHGEEAEYVASSGGSHIVRPIYEDENESWSGEPTTWREVYAAPPISKIANEASILNKEKERITAEIDALKLQKNQHAVEARQVESDRDHILGKYKDIRGLRALEAILDGKATHAVVSGWGAIKVLSLKDPARGYWERFDSITLVALSKQNTEWRFTDKDNRTSNGDLFTSEDDAMDYARGLFGSACDKYLTGRSDVRIEYLIETSQSLGFTLPETISKRLEDAAINKARQAVDAAEKQLAQARKNLAAFEPELEPATT